eukprot:SAG31_NODE_4203_length_3477_cov_5.894316_5_plen_87_part_00
MQHRAGFIHRDLKAQNIFLDERGNIKLGDFGLARKLDGSILAATTVGTPYHLSPEICKGQPYDSSSGVCNLKIPVAHFIEFFSTST